MDHNKKTISICNSQIEYISNLIISLTKEKEKLQNELLLIKQEEERHDKEFKAILKEGYKVSQMVLEGKIPYEDELINPNIFMDKVPTFNNIDNYVKHCKHIKSLEHNWSKERQSQEHERRRCLYDCLSDEEKLLARNELMNG